MSDKRIAYIDIAKGIAILSVVLLHVGFTYPECKILNISAMLGWSWHVPVFFCIGGFFIKEDNLLKPKSFIIGKIKSLYLLTLYLYLPATLLHNLFLNIGWYATDVSYSGKILSYWNIHDYIIGVIKTLACAGREPIMGAMWFVYVLLFALCGYSIISWALSKLFVNHRGGEEKARFIVLLTLQIISCVATNKLDFMIPRFSNAISVIFLIYLGQQIHNTLKWKFNNVTVFIVTLLIVYQSSLLIGPVAMNTNNFRDIFHLSIVTVAAVYMVCFLSKRLDGTFVGKIMALCGKESFYIMGLHIVGFRLCTMFLMKLGVVNGGLANTMTPPIGNNIILLIVYTAFGFFLPVLFIYLFRTTKQFFLGNVIRKKNV